MDGNGAAPKYSLAVGDRHASTDDRAISRAWEMSYCFAAGYTIDAGGGLGAGAEISFTSLPERSTGIAALQLRAQYTISF